MRKLLLAGLLFVCVGEVVAQPTIVSAIAPNNGTAYTGNTYQYTGIFQDNGAGVLYAFFDIETWPAGPFTCKVGVLIQDGAPIGNNQVYSQVFLHDDQGNQFTHYMTSGSSSEAPESNSKCTLFAVGSFVTHVGNQYSVTVSLRFNDPYDGGKAISLLAIDNNYGGTSWIAPSSVYVAGTNYGPQTYSVSPASGSSTSGAIQQFQVTVKDPNGIYTVPHMEFMLGMAPSWVFGWQIQPNQRCKVGSEISANLMWLEDAVNQNEYVAPGYVNPGGGSPTLQNSLCTFYPSMSSVTYPAIDTAVITFAVSFQPVFGGSLQDHIFVLDNTGLQHWDGDSSLDARWIWSVSSSQPVFQPTGIHDRGRAFGLQSTDSSGYEYTYNDGSPTTISYAATSGDSTYFQTPCSVSGSGVTADLYVVDKLDIDITYTASAGAAAGLRSASCTWSYGGWSLVYTWYFDVLSSVDNVITDTELTNGDLTDAVVDSQDNGDGTVNLTLTGSGYGVGYEYGFFSAADITALPACPIPGPACGVINGAEVLIKVVVTGAAAWQLWRLWHQQRVSSPYGWPGDNPAVAPRPGWVWGGSNPVPGTPEGGWTNPSTGESLSPDLEHEEPFGPHWDYKDPNGRFRTPGGNKGWRIWPDGTMTPKK